MKKSVEVRYPHSANLFQFCRRVLDHKFGGIRVIDQDVGQILGFDPADCSHWKKGKKNVRSIAAMKSIAERLGVDERLVVDVAAGEMDDQEAYYEFCGYGSFDVDAKIVEAARKEYYRRNAGSWTREKEMEFRTRFDANEPMIDKIVQDIHTKIEFQEAPLYLPEVANAFPGLTIETAAQNTDTDHEPAPVQTQKTENSLKITCKAGSEMRPFTRFRIAKVMAEHFLPSSERQRLTELGEYGQHVIEVQNNLFAAKLLTPASLLRKEIANVNVAKDIIDQLAEVFWVSKGFMNRRLKEIVERQPAI